MPPDIIDSEVPPQVTSTSAAEIPDSQSAAPSTPPPDAGSQQTAVASTSPDAGAAQTPVAGQTPVSPASTTPFSVRDFAAARGVDVARQYGDDASFTEALFALMQTRNQQLQEAQRMAQYGNLWLQHQSQQQAPAATPQADPLAQYKAPQFDPRWEQSLIRDPATGEIKLAPGADPTILPKFHAYQQHRQNVFQKLADDPAEFLKPLVAQMLAEQGKQVDKQVEGRLSQLQEEQYSNNWLQQNRAWVFARGADGREIINPATQQPIMTPQAQRFTQYMQAAKQAGATTTQAQEWIARLGMAAEHNMPNIATQQAVATGQQQQQNVLNTMNRNPNASGSMLNPAQTGHQAPAQQNPGLSLREQLMANAAGLKDEDFAL